MNKKLTYQTPRVLAKVGVQLECDFLKGSVVDNLTVVSVGQEVEEYDFKITEDPNPFTITWED